MLSASLNKTFPSFLYTVLYFSIFYYITISCVYLFPTPNSRSVFHAKVWLNIHSFITVIWRSFIHSFITVIWRSFIHYQDLHQCGNATAKPRYNTACGVGTNKNTSERKEYSLQITAMTSEDFTQWWCTTRGVAHLHNTIVLRERST